MFIDTHCHLNAMVKTTFDTSLTQENIAAAQAIAEDAKKNSVTTLINVGTSLIESKNCIELAKNINFLYATVGIHPNDCTDSWKKDFAELKQLVAKKIEYKIVGIGECGLDFHYPDYNKQRQIDAFIAQIELALTYDLAIVVHMRDAGHETLRILESFKGQITRGIIHCFSEDLSFAQQVIEWSFSLGIGGTITYPKNEYLRTVARTVPLQHIVLETDAPFLPPQSMRGKQNHPKNIILIAQYLAELRSEAFESIGTITTDNAQNIFKIHNNHPH